MEGVREQDRGIGGMSGSAASWLAWSLWALSLPSAAFSGVLAFLSASAHIAPDSDYIGLLDALLALTFPTIGALIASRRPENPIGWNFCAGGLVLSIAVSATNYAEYALHASTGPLPGQLPVTRQDHLTEATAKEREASCRW